MKLLNRHGKLILLVLLCIVAFMPIFLNLGGLPIKLWDELRLAMNAVQMNQDGDWITTHFGNQPDMWNTKPPLMIWLQVLLIKTIGPDKQGH